MDEQSVRGLTCKGVDPAESRAGAQCECYRRVIRGHGVIGVNRPSPHSEGATTFEDCSIATSAVTTSIVHLCEWEDMGPNPHKSHQIIVVPHVGAKASARGLWVSPRKKACLNYCRYLVGVSLRMMVLLSR
jgi:hypothetical protein